jgi:hypothetical protein
MDLLQFCRTKPSRQKKKRPSTYRGWPDRGGYLGRPPLPRRGPQFSSPWASTPTISTEYPIQRAGKRTCSTTRDLHLSVVHRCSRRPPTGKGKRSSQAAARRDTKTRRRPPRADPLPLVQRSPLPSPVGFWSAPKIPHRSSSNSFSFFAGRLDPYPKLDPLVR